MYVRARFRRALLQNKSALTRSLSKTRFLEMKRIDIKTYCRGSSEAEHKFAKMGAAGQVGESCNQIWRGEDFSEVKLVEKGPQQPPGMRPNSCLGRMSPEEREHNEATREAKQRSRSADTAGSKGRS